MTMLEMWLWLTCGIGALGGLGAAAHYCPLPTAILAGVVLSWGAFRVLREGRP